MQFSEASIVSAIVVFTCCASFESFALAVDPGVMLVILCPLTSDTLLKIKECVLLQVSFSHYMFISFTFSPVA